MRVTSAALSPLPDAARPPWAVGSPLRLLAAVLVSGSAVLLFAVHARPLGYVPLVLGVALGLLVDRRLGRDLALVGIGMGIISTISLKADLSENAGMVRFAVVLSLAVLVPWALSRFVFREDAVTFPVATGRRWSGGRSCTWSWSSWRAT